MTAWIVIVVLALVGLFDLWLGFTGRTLITTWYHRLFPRQIDLILMVSLFGLIWWIGSEQIAAWVAVGVTVGHLMWNSEQDA